MLPRILTGKKVAKKERGATTLFIANRAFDITNLHLEVINKVDYLNIWKCDDNQKSLCKIIISNDNSIDKAIDAILQEKCFQGNKTFLEIENAIHVDAVF